jgi:hypothetical protein
VELEDIRKYVSSGKTLEEVLEKFDWKSFENTVGNIFSSNGFRIFMNFRFKTKSRFEIDVVAVRGSTVFLVDCKEWGKGRDKKSGLRSAVQKQEGRVSEFKKFIRGNFIIQLKMDLVKGSKFFPLIVTLLQEELHKEQETLIVPVWKLNSFLLESESYS